MKNVVIVESPAKSKTINKYLGKDFHVLASIGHVRDLPSKEGSVDPDNHFAMVWESNDRSKKQMQEISKAVKGAQTLYLATDPDREGEAISWHVLELLKAKKLLKGVDVKRVVFYEITKRAILEAMEAPRSLNTSLIDAYLARRALDYLVGFTLSPVLWRKLPGSRSAGRVQSVTLRLITDRELEIEAFKAEEYWTIEADFQGKAQKKITSKLTHLNGKKLDKFSLNSKALTDQAVEEIERHTYAVAEIQKKQSKRHPTAPFITSTLQQEASRKLGFNARKTMQIAQQLYEGIAFGGEVTGLITYMRTDSVTVSQEAITASRSFIDKEYGKPYLPTAPRLYKSKTKNAQEAHEAIRPTDVSLKPQIVASSLSQDQLKLYGLIWKRMMASQMESALLDQVSIDFANKESSIIFRATGSTIAFDGFLKVYEEGKDTHEESQKEKSKEKQLPKVEQGEPMDMDSMNPQQHFTQPPPRYTEATLVKKLEELGIGRPSTYASITQTLIDRAYVKREKGQMIPEARGRVVTEFLVHFFSHYVEYDFTAQLENQLDDVSNGKLNWESLLSQFWEGLKANVDKTKPLRISQVLDKLNETLGKALLGTQEDANKCTECDTGHLSLKVGKFGAFIGCSNYPDCKYTKPLGLLRDMSPDSDEGDDQQKTNSFETKVLGDDPNTGLSVTVRKGPYGFYLQWGEQKGKEKPKRIALKKGVSPQSITLEEAMSLGALPRTLGADPQSGETITAAIGRYGPYVKLGKTFASLAKTDDVLTVDLERALTLIKETEEKRNKKKSSKK